MKKLIVVLAVIGLLCASASPLMAGAIINKSNLSADYFRSLTRHASTDAIDIIAYNPAGLMKMENGMYVKGDFLYITKDYSNDVPNQGGFYAGISGEDGKFESDVPSIVPGLFAVYKEEKWAGYFAITVPGGGGEVDYEDGNARTSALAAGFILNGLGSSPVQSMELEANSFAIGYTVGGAYEINDMFSVAGGLRYIKAHQEFKGAVDINSGGPLPPIYQVDLEREATGLGYFLGLNIAPMDKLNIGLLYQSNTELDYESDVKEDNSPGALITNNVGWPDGSKEREDLPGLIGLGIGYQFTPKLRCELGYTRYLESSAEWEGNRFTEDEGDSWEIGISATYQFNDQWRASIGYLHTDIVDIEPTSMLPEAPELDARTIGLGVVYSPDDRWDISFGYTNVNYDSETTSNSPDPTAPENSRTLDGTKLEKHSTAFSLGVQYRF